MHCQWWDAPVQAPVVTSRARVVHPFSGRRSAARDGRVCTIDRGGCAACALSVETLSLYRVGVVSPGRTSMKKSRVVTLGISGSLTRPFRDARRFPSTRL
jgi:hypothetical protein